MSQAEDKIVKFIRDYMQEYGWSPTVREIAKGTYYCSPSTVQGYLIRLADQERIVYQGVRQIRVVE